MMTKPSSRPSRIVLTHHIKITSIITYEHVTSFSAFDATVFMSFMETSTVSGYFMTPHFQGGTILSTFFTLPTTTIQCHKLQYLLHLTHTSPMYAQTSSWNSLPKMTYLYQFGHTNILCICPAITEFQIPPLYLTRTFNPMGENSNLHGTL